ncbi:hypothetical protein PIROE2DRAFT_12477 [Piromyces sp. E2]|nr:hypothetical protein PIROE2DRAFT_12477 [Piromyces sp. E2]|eukprot:OUM61519.1 hypothetical protein PIROE2DRAFT_12477 [Piromyces sp. E2]
MNIVEIMGHAGTDPLLWLILSRKLKWFHYDFIKNKNGYILNSVYVNVVGLHTVYNIEEMNVENLKNDDGPNNVHRLILKKKKN